MKMKISIFLFVLLTTVTHFRTVLAGFSLFGIRLFGDSGFKEDFAQANEAFALRLMNLLEDERNGTENVFLSPFSIGLCLALAMIGARGETYSQIYNTLGFSSNSLSANDIADGYRQLMTELSTNNVTVANAITLGHNITVGPEYGANLQTNFNSTVFRLGLDSRATANLINQWVREKTHGMIQNMITEENLQPLSTIAVLLNTIFFSSAWSSSFRAMRNGKQKFYSQSSKPEEQNLVEFMYNVEYYRYGHFDDGQMVELPYHLKNVSMFVFLPLENCINMSSLFVGSLTSKTLSSRIAQLKYTRTYIQMPKFKFEVAYKLEKALQQLGIVYAFNPATADFSLIDSRLSLWDVLHKAVIEVDRYGTRAAASTAIFGDSISAKPHVTRATVVLNRPFVFFIRENVNGVVLFEGIINRL